MTPGLEMEQALFLHLGVITGLRNYYKRQYVYYQGMFLVDPA